MTRSLAIIPRSAALFAAILVLTLCGVIRAAFPWASLNLGGAVNDYAGLLSANERSALEAELVRYNRESGNALVLVTISSLAGGDIDDAANRIFARAGIGEKGKDNGVLLLVALNDRKMRIEVGYGLEPVLTDAQCAAIIRRDLTPAFKAGQYYRGIDAAFADMRTIIGGGVLPSAGGAGNANLTPKDFFLFALSGIVPFFALLVFFILFVALILIWAKHSTPGASWSTILKSDDTRGTGSFHSGGFHSGGGGFGGFGGGHSGGGGSHGGW